MNATQIALTGGRRATRLTRHSRDHSVAERSLHASTGDSNNIDSALRAEDLDEAAALEARERAREALEGRHGEIDLEQAQRDLVEAEARYRAAENLKGRR